MKQNRRFNTSYFIIMLLAANLIFLSSGLLASEASTVLLITDDTISPTIQHGVKKVRIALQAKGIPVEQTTSLGTIKGNLLLIAGLSDGNGSAAKLHDSLDISKPKGAESLIIRHTKWSGKKTLLVSGSDDRGLMYALLDVADRIGWSTNSLRPFSEVRNIQESPSVPERALSIYTMHQANFESYFYDEDYWERYLDMLAENRFNTFADERYCG